MYSSAVGVIYVFNLIVGTGALTLPKAMASAGWLLSVILLSFLGLMSYVTTTFVIESLSIANACIRQAKKDNDAVESEASDSDSSLRRLGRSKSDIIPSEHSPLLPPASSNRSCLNVFYSSNREASPSDHFAITQAVEMGEMADMFFNKVGRTLFYLCIAIYLYGDLAIYAAAIPKSLRDIACQNMSCTAGYPSNSSSSDSDICWGSNITRMDVYRIFLAIVTLALGPFAYFSVQKTKYLQISTSLYRWLAFGFMIVMAIVHIAIKGGAGRPPVASISGVPNLFGVSVYSFMCQHSLPSLVTPIRDKRQLFKLLAADYILVFFFYSLLGFTAIFCFESSALMDIYTLNFQDSCEVTDVSAIRYFLGLFPVFALSANFPIIAVTLRNNLKALFPATTSVAINRVLFPSMAVIPPIAVAFATNDLTTLVGVTGSYAGAGVQYVVPACLVLLARREAGNVSCRSDITKNPHRSPFSRRLWVIVVLAWATVCLIFVTTNHILTWAGH